MKRVSSNPELFKLLTSFGFNFTENWYLFSSEESMEEFTFIQAFFNMSIPSEVHLPLNEEQVLYKITNSIITIRGSVNFLLIKN